MTMQTTQEGAALGGSEKEIDKALRLAQERQAAKKAGGNGEAAKPAGVPKAEANKKTDDERKALQAAKEAERAAQRAEREQERAKRKAEKDAERAAKKNAHMGKVEKAAARLPQLTVEAQAAVEGIVTGFSAADAGAIAVHINHRCRALSTEKALGGDIKVGDRVRITSGDTRFLNKEGAVQRSQRIRCYVEVPGVERPVYLFKSDVELVERPEAAAASEAN